jgi:hypothetical protein
MDHVRSLHIQDVGVPPPQQPDQMRILLFLNVLLVRVLLVYDKDARS